MARIKGVQDSEAGLVARGAYRAAAKMTGQVPEPMRIQAHSPWVMRAVGAYEIASRRAKALDDRLKSLASIKVASMIGCVF